MTRVRPCPIHRCQASKCGQTISSATEPTNPPASPETAPDKRGLKGSDLRHTTNSNAMAMAPNSSYTKWVDGVYLSNSNTFDGSATQIGTLSHASLASGSFYDATGQCTIPAGAGVGDKYIFV